jgi:type IV fimbrial biogenesis protein FimT
MIKKVGTLESSPLRQRIESRSKGAGFTLIELMIVLAIMGVILSLALPGFSEITLSTKLKAYANELVASAYLARSEAIKRNVPMTLCASDDGASCASSGDWEQGWIVLDPNNVVVRQQAALSSGYKVTSTGGRTLTFDPSGAAGTPTTMKVCRKTPTAGGQDREVKISATGRPRVTRKTSGTCL